VENKSARKWNRLHQDQPTFEWLSLARSRPETDTLALDCEKQLTFLSRICDQMARENSF
jgi:hypothetical protein